MSDNDDLVGRILSRREVLGLLGAAGAALLVACSSDGSSKEPSATATQGASSGSGSTGATSGGATGTSAAAAADVPACVVRPALTEGPYFVDEKLNRSDIRSDPSDGSVKPGTPLVLTINVSRLANNQCGSLANAVVDVWHCDALGVYSDVSDPGFNTKGTKFLRGYQNTNANGKVTFTTIYPGWYQGRAVHIHFKIRSGNTEFTSQWFFDESVTDQVYSQAPYSQKSAGGRTLNDRDGIYRQAGQQMILKTVKTGDGYAATFDIGLQG